MAFCSRTHSLYKVKVNDIFSGGYKVATKEPLSWGLCYNKDKNSNSYNYCDEHKKIFIHVFLKLHTMVEVLCLSIGIYLFYKSNNNCTFFYLCFNYFLILYCSILSYVETWTEILCLDVKLCILQTKSK